MFDFLDSDWFIITLEIIFIILIYFDVRKYMLTKKREYIMNIVLTAGFAIWTLYPMYISYFGWNNEQKQKMLQVCDDSNDTKLCNCVDEKIFKEYVFDTYKVVDKNTTEYKEFIKETQAECLDDSWF